MNGAVQASLFEPLSAQELQLRNRIVMPPLTRMRADDGGVPGSLSALYYSQRASAGLIITEASHISEGARGLPRVPGIYTPQQISGWRRVSDAVHAAGGTIVQQLFHVGRLSHPSFLAGRAPLGPSNIAAPGQGYSADFTLQDFVAPRALALNELGAIVAEFRQAALNARTAGMDGVELHAANGYLLEQFLVDGCNQRNDEYGGPIENRARLLLQVLDAVCDAIGPGRVGVRLSPYGRAGGSHDSCPAALYTFLIEQISRRRNAYLHLIEARASGVGRSDQLPEAAMAVAPRFRAHYSGVLISSGGYTRATAEAALEAGHADAIGFGRLFIANPDLPERLLHKLPLQAYQRATFYGGGAEGYTDYPAVLSNHV